MTGEPSVEQELEPLRATLLARARGDAAERRAAAQRRDRESAAAAQQQASVLLADARALGLGDAARMRAADRAQARRAAHEIVLTAQQEVYEEVRRQARVAVAALLADPAVRRALTATLHTRLGAGATVQDAAGGGLVAQAPDGRRVDASVDALVDRALALVDLEQLWIPS